MTTEAVEDVNALIDQGALPKVEEWKQQMMKYKSTSISLGVIDDQGDGVQDSPFVSKTSSPPQLTHPPQPQPTDETLALPEGILLSAEVVSFHSEMEEYWFRVHTIFQPYNPNASFDLPPARQHVLYRCYNDFYDFQIELLEKFPREAGREAANPSPRLIPYMPGPVEHVDDEITLTRKDELDRYLRSLCKLKETMAKYILESMVVRKFLAIKPGDAEAEIDPCIEEIQEIFGSEDLPDGHPQEPPHDDPDGLHDQMGRMDLNGGYDNGYDGADPPSGSRAHDPYNHNEGKYDRRFPKSLTSQNHQRTGSAVSGYSSSTGNSPQPAPTKPSWAGHPYSGGGWDRSNGHNPNEHGRTSVNSVTSPTSARSSQPSAVTRSHSNAARFNTPPISSTNPTPAYIKIKIFDSITEDLIAIRVHPRVSHAQLMDKVQSRLGTGVKNLKYRESTSGSFMELLDDEKLRRWIGETNRHVLYAD